MSPIDEYANSLPANEIELKSALFSLQDLINGLPEAENKLRAADNIWQTWAKINKDFQLAETKPYPDQFQWSKFAIYDYLDDKTRAYSYNDGEDPIYFEPLKNSIRLRSGHRFEASSLLQHFQAGYRTNPLTNDPISEEEFNELVYKLVNACYFNQINRKDNIVSWHLNMGMKTFVENHFICAAFACYLYRWIQKGFEIDTPLIPVMLLCVPLMQAMFGYNVFLGLPPLVDTKDKNGNVKLPTSLSVFKVANNTSREPTQPPAP